MRPWLHKRVLASISGLLVTVGGATLGHADTDGYVTGCSEPYGGLRVCSEAPFLMATHLGTTKLVRWVEGDRTVQINFRVMAKGNEKWLTAEKEPEVELEALHESNTEIWSLTRKQNRDIKILPLEYVGQRPVLFTHMPPKDPHSKPNLPDWLFATAGVCGAAIIMEQFHKPDAPVEDMIRWSRQLVAMAHSENGECEQNG